jgi:Tfp pilus assembly protein PilN
MENSSLDQLQQAFKRAVDLWVDAIRAEESLATANHSETAMEKWDRADFVVQDAAKQAKEARDNYKEGLRHLHYGI